MQKKWYIIYTRPKCEKKVVHLLTKKKIENFCPVNCKKIRSYRRNKLQYEPLFPSYVFVNISDQELSLLKQIDHAISLVYWKNEPATVKDEEIEAIKEFTTQEQEIELERTEVNVSDKIHILGGPEYSIDRNIFSIRHKSLKVNLPSLGYKMVVKIKDESIFSGETTLLQDNSFHINQVINT